MGQRHAVGECGYTVHFSPCRNGHGAGIAGNIHADFWTAMDWILKFGIVSALDVSVPVGVVDVELARYKRLQRMGLQLGIW